jgi:4-hydroxybenzoate polyprenyltransferase/phosphoglycolate phosphatase-like HAD superfamily hydrolase
MNAVIQSADEIAEKPTDHLPLAVDLDGTLATVNTMHELMLAACLANPQGLVWALLGLSQGPQEVKARLVDIYRPSASALPLRQEVLELLRQQATAGHELALVSAADDRVVQQVAAVVGGFTVARGSDRTTNLKGEHKAAWLRQQFPRGFLYAGDSAADLPVWRASAGAILVGRAVRHVQTLRREGVPVLQRIPSRGMTASDWLVALRLHQWPKNLLLVVPLLLSQLVGSPIHVLHVAAAFVILGLLVSGTYLANDLADIEADRQHPMKRLRAIASGRLPCATASVVAVALIAVGLVGAWALSAGFAELCLVYLLASLAYSGYLKHVPLLDVCAIAGLFTLRVFMGLVLLDQPRSSWLLSFTAAFFLALALAKRHAELMAHAHTISSRGYQPEDWPLTLAFGVASSAVAVTIMLLYLWFDAAPPGLYRNLGWLYVSPALLLLFAMRVWFYAHRGVLTNDPVVFALQDPVTWFLAAALGVSWALAVYGW